MCNQMTNKARLLGFEQIYDRWKVYGWIIKVWEEASALIILVLI